MTTISKSVRPSIPTDKTTILMILLNLLVAVAYFIWWLDLDQAKNIWLYTLLFVGEIYHVVMALTFWYTVRATKSREVSKGDVFFTPSVDVFITVAGEPASVVEETLLAAKQMQYPDFSIYLLNDGLVAKKDNWQEIENLASRHHVNCITRTVPGGAKAGNINNALKNTQGELVVIFDADMVPERDFLRKMVPYFIDPKMGFVQSPQYYKNAGDSEITGAAWEQQALFFGPIMQGKNNSNSAFICGTNVVIRRQTLDEVGGLCEDNIAEDFITSLDIHRNGWSSYYHPEVLSQGLAPQDLQSYVKQQLRWARGSLEVLFQKNPLFQRGFSWRQKLEYLSSGLYYLNGLVVAIDILIPITFLYGGLEPVSASTTTFALLFTPFILVNLLTLYHVSGQQLSWRAFAFSQSSWFLQLIALQSVIRGNNMKFEVTPKQAQAGNYLSLALPHLIYIVIALGGILVALWREGLTPAVATNISWAMFNSLLFLPFIYSAYDWSKLGQLWRWEAEKWSWAKQA